MTTKPEIRQLEIFIAIYKSGNFTKASEGLDISQPAISAQIKNLESCLGVRLFDRLGRFIKPTPAADLLFPKALEIIDDIEGLEDLLDNGARQMTGEITIGASSIPGAYLLPPIAARFKEQHPGISFEIRIADSGEIIESILGHDLTVGIVGAKNLDKNLSFIPLIEDELVLAAGARYQVGDRVEIKQLLEMPFLLREEGSGTRKAMEEAGTGGGFSIERLNTVAVLGSNAAIKEAIKADLGVSILSKISIMDEIRAGRIKEVKIEGVTMGRMFYIVHRRGRTLPTAYTTFMELLRQAGEGS